MSDYDNTLSRNRGRGRVGNASEGDAIGVPAKPAVSCHLEGVVKTLGAPRPPSPRRRRQAYILITTA
eukprot:6507715-Pyramimonas_sp.AAC.1